MFWDLFDLTYERDLYESFVFYFVYFVFAFSIAGVFYSSTNLLYFISHYFSGFTATFLTYYIPTLTFLTPSILYLFLSIAIFKKKKLRDRNSFLLLIISILVNFAPLFLAIYTFICNYGHTKSLLFIIGLAFVFFFMPILIVGGIPATILSTKEDLSLSKEIQQMEQEKLEHENWIEEQLLTERAITSKLEEKKQTNDNEEKEVLDED